MDMKLNVCFPQGGSNWVAYVVRKNQAFSVFEALNLDDCREYALSLGYSGILLGSPSVPWGNSDLAS